MKIIHCDITEEQEKIINTKLKCILGLNKKDKNLILETIIEVIKETCYNQ